MPTGDAVDRRFNESMEMHQDLKLETLPAQDEYSFYVATDPHVNKTHENLSIFNDAMRNDMSASFGVVLGDCIDVKDNLPKYLEALAYDSEKHSSDPRIFHITGNHDLYFDGWDDFKNQIGPSVYWFDVIFSGGKDLFISVLRDRNNFPGLGNRQFLVSHLYHGHMLCSRTYGSGGQVE